MQALLLMMVLAGGTQLPAQSFDPPVAVSSPAVPASLGADASYKSGLFIFGGGGLGRQFATWGGTGWLFSDGRTLAICLGGPNLPVGINYCAPLFDGEF